MSDTPETDTAWNAAPTEDVNFGNAGWDFARKLERERDEARAALSVLERIVANGSSHAMGAPDPWEWVYGPELRQARAALGWRHEDGPCNHCGGRGSISPHPSLPNRTCPNCKGTGITKQWIKP